MDFRVNKDNNIENAEKIMVVVVIVIDVRRQRHPHHATDEKWASPTIQQFSLYKQNNFAD